MTAWLLSSLVAGTAAAADVSAADWVAQTLASTRAPGVAMAFSRDGQVESAVGGVRLRGQIGAAGPDDLWHIGSNTKSMTATLIARLAEDGQIRWDDTIGAVLGPIVPIDPAYQDVTYADLIQHRSGMAANIVDPTPFVGTLAERDMLVDRLDYAAQMLTAAPVHPHGTFHYSNAGYVVAGAMLQQSTGRTWEALLQPHVLDPLGLTSVGFGPPGAGQPQGHRGWLVRPAGTGATADNIPALGPAGTVHISVGDMLRYLRAHARADATFLSDDSWALLHTPPTGESYAMGWVATPQGWRAHDGSNTLWYSTVGFVPGQDRAVVMVANFAGRSAVAAAMAQGARAALGD